MKITDEDGITKIKQKVASIFLSLSTFKRLGSKINNQSL